MAIKLNLDKIKVLLVDDDVNDCTLFKGHIKRLNKPEQYEIETINTYDNAIKVISHNLHDIYFIDYTLDTRNGMHLIEQAISNGNNGPFILLTGIDRPDLYQHSSQSGVFDYLLKNEISPSIIDRSITYAIEREKIQSQLMTEKNLVENIIKDTPYIVMRIKKDGHIHSTNPAFLKITGYDENDIKDISWKSLNAKKDTEITTDGAPFKAEIICKDNRQKTIEWAILPHNHEDNYISITGKDVTIDLEKEEKRRQADKMKALGHLAGGVAHEINNLLQPIVLNSEWICEKTLDKDILESANEIISNADIASSIVEDILIFSRQDNQSLEELNFLEFFNKSYEIARKMLNENIRVTLTNHSVAKNRTCLFRLKDMVRVLSNILLNAADATNNQGDIKIDLYEDLKTNSVKFDITDKGHGIPKENIDAIFNPFFTTKDIGEGTGLGLTMVYNLIKNWNGSLTVKSTEGEGSCFSIYIPISNL